MIPNYVLARASEFSDVALYWPRTAIVDVIKPDGFAIGGLYVDHNAGTRKVKVDDDGEEYTAEVGHEYYPILARILKTHLCREVKVGDVVRITAMNYEDVDELKGGFAVMHERSMLAVIEGFDEAAIPYVGDQTIDPGEDDEPDDMARPELLDEPDQDYGEEDDASPHFDEVGNV